MPLIRQFDTPLDPNGDNIEYISIFRVDVETHRDNGTYEPKLDVYYCACDASGVERIQYTPEGKPYPLAPTFKKFKFDQTTQAMRDAYKALLQATYDALADDLEPGVVQDV